MAAGMAKGGLRPVAAIYSTFLQRGYDQVFQEIALQNLPVLLALDRAGLVGQDGPTHNGVFDIAFLRTLPNMVLAAPRDATDMQRMLELGLAHEGPFALRFPRDACPGVERIHPSERRTMAVGKAETLCEGKGIVLWAYGALVTTALEVAEAFRQRGVAIGVVDARFAKPLDTELLAQDARRYKAVVTLEEHQRAGGFGSAVLEAVAALPVERAPRVKVCAIPDRYLPHMSSREEQLALAGLDRAGIERVVRNLLAPSLV
jgi:1-deoxy-D-xylulose-5-phosphate synthase